MEQEDRVGRDQLIFSRYFLRSGYDGRGYASVVAAFLALAVTGLASPDVLARAAYLGMGVTGWFAIVPWPDQSGDDEYLGD